MHFQNPKDFLPSREGLSVSRPYPPVAHKLGCAYLWPCFSLCPCICRAICSLRARRAHCAYRRVLSRTDSAPAARNIAPVGASIPHRLFHCQSYWRTHPEPFGARECNTDTPSDQKASRGVPERLRPSQGAPERPGASQSFQVFGSTEL